jgi:hypothetical protein
MRAVDEHGRDCARGGDAGDEEMRRTAESHQRAAGVAHDPRGSYRDHGQRRAGDGRDGLVLAEEVFEDMRSHAVGYGRSRGEHESSDRRRDGEPDDLNLAARRARDRVGRRFG